MPRLNRTEFLQVLQAVSPGLSMKDNIQQSSCFVLSDGWVVTFNGEIACRIRTGLPEEYTGAVRADPLLRVVQNIPDDELVIELDDDASELRVKGPGSRTDSGIRMEKEILLPVEEVERPEGWEKLPPDFADAVKQVEAAAGTNVEEFLTVCVHIHPDFLEACDRFQATRYFIKMGVDKPFLVRATSLKHVAALGMTKMGQTDNWVHFRNPGGMVYSCRRHLEQFPDMAEMLDFRGKKAVLPNGAVEAAKLGEVFSGEDKDNNKVLVRLTDDRMIVKGEGSYGWASRDLNMSYRGEPTTFRINPALLIKLVSDHKECEIGPDKLRVDGERWVYLTVLGKAKKEKDEPKPRKRKSKSDDTEEREERQPEPVGAEGDPYDRPVPF